MEVFFRPLGNAIGCESDGESRGNRGQGLKGLWVRVVGPGEVWSMLEKEEGRSDWKTVPFSLRTGTAPAVDWMGGCFMSALGTDMLMTAVVLPKLQIPNSEQAQRQQTLNSSAPKATGRSCVTDRNSAYSWARKTGNMLQEDCGIVEDVLSPTARTATLRMFIVSPIVFSLAVFGLRFWREIASFGLCC